MAIMELQAAIGEALALRLDYLWNEVKPDSTRQIENAAAWAKSKGYQPQGKAAATGIQTFFIEVPSTVLNGQYVPDDTYSPILRKGARVVGPNGIAFETLDDVNFATSSVDYPRQVTGSKFDPNSGFPTNFVIRKNVPIIAGQTVVDTVALGAFQPFLPVTLSQQDVLEIESVVDANGNEWFQVDYLADDTVFDQVTNQNNDAGTVPYVLKLNVVPRRFVADRDVLTNTTTLIFGNGDGVNFDDELIPNLADLALPLAGRRTFTSFSVDPQNFLKTRTLGLSPYNTTLTITYRVGGGTETNVPPGSINSVVQSQLDFSTSNLSPTKRAAVVNSIQTLNLQRTDGGAPAESIAQMKANADAFFAAQSRCVTVEDYIARVYSLPARFGKPYKVFAKRTNALINTNSIDVHVLTVDSNNYLVQASTTLVQNVQTYLRKFRMMTEGINILQTEIINLKYAFGIVVSPKYNRTDVITRCIFALKDYFDTSRMQIGQPIIISEVQAMLQGITGVVSIYKSRFSSIYCPQYDENNYSTVRFDVSANTQNGMIICPPNACFEFKFPQRDFSGEGR